MWGSKAFLLFPVGVVMLAAKVFSNMFRTGMKVGPCLAAFRNREAQPCVKFEPNIIEPIE